MQATLNMKYDSYYRKLPGFVLNSVTPFILLP